MTKLTDNDIVRLKEMFIDIFSEDKQYVDRMFENKFTPENTFIIREGGKIVSMAYCMYFQAKIGSISGKCVYVYGVGTDVDCRGKGYMSRIMHELYAYYKNKDILFLYLVPANEGLFKMYEKLGYQTAFYLNHAVFDCPISLNQEFQISGGDFHKDYTSFIKQFENVIIRSKQDNDLILQECKYEKQNSSGFLYYIIKEKAIIRESFLYNEDDFQSFCGYLYKKGIKSIKRTTPSLTSELKKSPYAMVKFISKEINIHCFDKPSYTNINFD